MSRIRDLKRQARRAIHREFQIDALYLVPAVDGPGYDLTLPVQVRLHLRAVELGDLKGTNFHYADRHDNNPQIIFLREQVALPARNAVVSIEVGEAYRIDNLNAPEDITIAANVTRMPLSETVGLPIPGEGGELFGGDFGFDFNNDFSIGVPL